MEYKQEYVIEKDAILEVTDLKKYFPVIQVDTPTAQGVGDHDCG